MTIPGPFVLGTAQLGAVYGIANRIGALDKDASIQLIKAAWDAGVRAFDTAPAYGDAELRLGEALEGCRYWVSTKIPSMKAVPDAALVESVRRSVERSLERLRRSKIDVVLLHDSDDLQRGPAIADALELVRHEGLIGQWGASVYTPADASAVDDVTHAGAMQIPANLLDFRFFPFLTGLRRPMSIVARSVYLQGALALSDDEIAARLPRLRPWIAALRKTCNDFGCTPLEIALPYARAIPGIDAVVIGLESEYQLQENLAAITRPVPSGLADALVTVLRAVDEEAVDPRRWPRNTGGVQ